MPDTSDIRRTTDALKSQFEGAVDNLSEAAADAGAAIRDAGARVADQTQSFYDELEGDAPADKLRNAIAEYPLASVLIAGAVGYLVSRLMNR